MCFYYINVDYIKYMLVVESIKWNTFIYSLKARTTEAKEENTSKYLLQLSAKLKHFCSSAALEEHTEPLISALTSSRPNSKFQEEIQGTLWIYFSLTSI